MVHVEEPTTEEYVPFAHVVQAIEPPREAVPTSHTVGSYDVYLILIILGGESGIEGRENGATEKRRW